jgi:hypothetical protein
MKKERHFEKNDRWLWDVPSHLTIIVPHHANRDQFGLQNNGWHNISNITQRDKVSQQVFLS